MFATCRAVDLPVERFPAFTPASVPERILDRFATNCSLLPGEVGCFASHLGVLELIADAKDGFYLVLEDDVQLLDQIRALRDALRNCSRPPEVLRLENPLKTAGLTVFATSDVAMVRALMIPNSAAAYLVTPRGADRLLDRAWDIDIPYDQFLREVGRVDVDMLVCSPPMIEHVNFGSTIAEPIGRDQKRNRRASFKGSGFSLLREIKFVGTFGALPFLRVMFAYLRMHLAGVKLDTEGRFIIGRNGAREN